MESGSLQTVCCSPSFNPGRWFFSEQQVADSPSRKFGISGPEESVLRAKVIRYIREASIKLRLPQVVIATASVYFHRFFSRRSFTQFNGNIIATACIFLASKVEEASARSRDVINVARRILTPNEALLDVDQGYWELKDQLIAAEQTLLRVLGYNLVVTHPYKLLCTYVQSFRSELSPAQTTRVAQFAWNVVNDSFLTTACLTHRPHVVACAALFFSLRLLEIDCILLRTPWWLQFDARFPDIETALALLLDMYENMSEFDAVGSTSASTTTSSSSSVSSSSSMVTTTVASLVSDADVSPTAPVPVPR
eukprot:gnl/Spiro4/2871_TR1411_c0_g1_i1.p1 gnl/Spiro4/2871_TR1411_c0_g1~~gnl/Spiro4/2871_TR1411_c0_g1_i1.p1  ORF type:complete len:359 (+),score=59.47 gnl/Spiro4/2871_TR1411_c0_g1_i1:156-1079(+)